MLLTLTIKYLQFRVKKARRSLEIEKNVYIKHALESLIQSYQETLMFLATEKEILKNKKKK